MNFFFLTGASRLYWLGRVKEAPESPCRWFFYDNYGKNIFNGESLINL
jgi:hypothetical protein